VRATCGHAAATVVDPGAQGERTYLAWQRTGLSFAAVGAGLIHFTGGLDRWPGFVAMIAGAAVLIRGRTRYREAIDGARGLRPTAAPVLVAAVAVATALVGSGTFFMLWLSHA
jgi:uncharacterized membrane protein YidH (DUF202 family)